MKKIMNNDWCPDLTKTEFLELAKKLGFEKALWEGEEIAIIPANLDIIHPLQEDMSTPSSLPGMGAIVAAQPGAIPGTYGTVGSADVSSVTQTYWKGLSKIPKAKKGTGLRKLQNKMMSNIGKRKGPGSWTIPGSFMKEALDDEDIFSLKRNFLYKYSELVDKAHSLEISDDFMAILDPIFNEIALWNSGEGIQKENQLIKVTDIRLEKRGVSLYNVLIELYIRDRWLIIECCDNKLYNYRIHLDNTEWDKLLIKDLTDLDKEGPYTKWITLNKVGDWVTGKYL